MRGAISVSMFPVPSVEFADVALGETVAGEAALAAEQLKVNLRLMPLLTGRIEIADISLVKPHIVVTVDPDGHTNWSPLIDILARALKPNAARDERVLSISENDRTRSSRAAFGFGGRAKESMRGVGLLRALGSEERGVGCAARARWGVRR